MNRLDQIQDVLRVSWTVIASVMATQCGIAADTVPRPNFILCMADDQGWGDVGYNGHPVLKTPVLDEMAATALRLDRFYAAHPVCSPTRAAVRERSASQGSFRTSATPGRSAEPTGDHSARVSRRTSSPRAASSV